MAFKPSRRETSDPKVPTNICADSAKTTGAELNLRCLLAFLVVQQIVKAIQRCSTNLMGSTSWIEINGTNKSSAFLRKNGSKNVEIGLLNEILSNKL